MQYKWFIFDLDGTLINSLGDIRMAINKVFLDYQIKANYQDSDIAQFIGNGSRKLIERATARYNFSSEMIEEFHQKYLIEYNANCNVLTKPYPNVLETLKRLKVKNIKLGVLSNKPDQDTKKVVNFYFKDLFDLVLGGRQGVKLKPDKEALEVIMKDNHLQKEDILYFGDMLPDLKLCENTQVDFAYMSYGYGQNIETYKYKFADFQEILQIVD